MGVSNCNCDSYCCRAYPIYTQPLIVAPDMRRGLLTETGGSGARQCSREFDVQSTQLCTCQSPSSPLRRSATAHTRPAATSAVPSARIVIPSSSRCVPPQCLRHATDLVSSCFSSRLQLQSLRTRHWLPNEKRRRRCEPSPKTTIWRRLRGLLYHNTRLISCSRIPVQGCAADDTAHDAAWEHWFVTQRPAPVAPPVVLVCQRTRCRGARFFDRSAT